MKDYSNYYPSSKDFLHDSGSILFNIQQQNALYEGNTVLIDNISSNVIIQEHTNEYAENKEERILHCLETILIHRGSLIYWNSEYWLVIADIDSNGIYKSTKILKCNNTLTFKNKTNTTIKMPIILSDQATSTDGIVISDKVTIQDNLRYVLVPYTNDTKELFLQQRFIFNHNSVFSISKIDDFTYFCNQNDSITNGILKLTLKEEQFIDGDDKANNLAYNGDLILNPIPTGDGYTFEIIGSDTIQKGYTETYIIKVYKDGVEEPVLVNHTCIWSLIDTNNSALLIGDTVSNTIQIKGLISVNHIMLQGTLSIDNSKIVDKDIIIVDAW